MAPSSITLKVTPNNVTKLEPNEVFVFGSNLAGIHGAGAAKYAYSRGWAQYGQGMGMFESRYGRSYAIATKDYDIKTLDVGNISLQIGLFLRTARLRPELEFLVTPIGCGLAGFKPEQIMKLFTNGVHSDSFQKVFPNVHLPQCFWDINPN